MKDTLYIVMPAYNEEANIQDVIQQWHPVCERINQEGNEAKLVIANDGSKDNTFTIMQSLCNQYPHLLPIDKPNSGHGATVYICIAMPLMLAQISFSKPIVTDKHYLRSFGNYGSITMSMTSK